MKVVILLATYNGQRYLSSQLDSVFAQNYTNFLLIIKDDCSSDNSVAVIKSYQQRYPDKVILLPTNPNNLGPLRTFSSLLVSALNLKLTHYCIAFCDQDDVWHPDKLQLSLECLQSHNIDVQQDTILIHTELTVVDQNGQTIADSLSEYQGLQPECNRFIDLIMFNAITGCTVLITPALARVCTPIPEDAYMHDWWCALIASLKGQIYFIPQPLVAYRQHSSNTLGARKLEAQTKMARLRALRDSKAHQEIKRVARQARFILGEKNIRLNNRQKLACVVTAYLMPYNRLLLRALAFKLLKYLRS